MNLKSCALTFDEDQCEDNQLQYIECDSPAEEVPSLGEEKSQHCKLQFYGCTMNNVWLHVVCRQPWCVPLQCNPNRNPTLCKGCSIMGLG